MEVVNYLLPHALTILLVYVCMYVYTHTYIPVCFFGRLEKIIRSFLCALWFRLRKAVDTDVV